MKLHFYSSLNCHIFCPLCHTLIVILFQKLGSNQDRIGSLTWQHKANNSLVFKWYEITNKGKTLLGVKDPIEIKFEQKDMDKPKVQVWYSFPLYFQENIHGLFGEPPLTVIQFLVEASSKMVELPLTPNISIRPR